MGFGDFSLVCHRANVPLCPVLGPYSSQNDTQALSRGLISGCYARSINLANTMIFNVGNVFIQFGTLLMVSISIYSTYQKYTAVGRREMLDLFYLFFFLTFWSMVIDSGVVPSSSESYPYFVAVQCGLSSAFCILLSFTSLLGFQLWEDGSPKSVWGLRLSSFLWGLVVFLVAMFTFQENVWGMSGKAVGPSHTTGLMVVLYIVNAIWIFLYACFILYLDIFILRNWWAAGAQALAGFLFVAGQVLMYAFGKTICDNVRHYVDGIFFATVCNLLAFLMIYKGWDIVTTEDLEFSVSNQDGTWDLKDTEDADGDAMDGGSEYALSNYNLATPYL